MIEAVKSLFPSRLHMHIVVMTRIMPGHSLGGMQKQTMDLCSGFVKLGHDVTVITTGRKDGKTSETIDGVKIYFLHGSKPGYYSRKWNALCNRKIRQLHQEHPIDVIHSQSMGAIGILKWAKQQAVPIVSTWHGTSLTEISTFLASASYHPRYWHWLLIMPTTMLLRYFTTDLAVRRASEKITLVSPTLEPNMKFLARNKVITIPNGIELPARIEKSEQNPIQCVAIGRMEKEKGIHFAIRSIANLPEELRNQVRLNVVGEGAYLTKLQQLSKSLNVDQNVAFHGRLDDASLEKIYADSRIHLMPTTRHEGLPLTILEGMAYSMATIASAIGGITGVITDGHDGLLIQPGNQAELDTALVNLLTDNELIQTMGNAARQTAEDRYSKQRMVDETMAVLIEVVNRD